MSRYESRQGCSEPSEDDLRSGLGSNSVGPKDGPKDGFFAVAFSRLVAVASFAFFSCKRRWFLRGRRIPRFGNSSHVLIKLGCGRVGVIGDRDIDPENRTHAVPKRVGNLGGHI